MVAARIDNVAMMGLVGCVPSPREDERDLSARFGEEAAARLVRATGIAARRIAPSEICTSDLAERAGRALIDRLGWETGDIQFLAMVTQTPDHILPSNAALLHARLGLPKSCAAFDIGLGCSGFVYGLWTAASMLRSLTGGTGRGLLCVGDTTARLCPPHDRAVAPLFGDGAAAIALETRAASAMHFDLGTDGTGAPYLMVAGGGQREPERNRHLFMDGTQVFAFTLREVPRSVASVLASAGWSPACVDRFVLHQANAQMIRHLGAKIGASSEQMVIALEEFGNTSSASIPLALLATGMAERLASRTCRLVLSGFGVGWSWASAAVEIGPLKVAESLVLQYPAP